MILTRHDLELLKQLQAAGERGKTVSTLAAYPALLRLLKGGYVVDRAADLDLINYRITRRGKDAILEYA
jgi:DNA-binding PadR family transcriptional regulator